MSAIELSAPKKYFIFWLMVVILVCFSVISRAQDPQVKLTFKNEGHGYLADYRNKNGVLSPDGKVLASSDLEPTIYIWDANNGRLNRVLSGHSGHVTSLAFSFDGVMLASSSDDGMIMLWKTNTGKFVRKIRSESLLGEFAGRSISIDSIAFNSDGKVLASSYSDKIKLWNVSNGKNIHTLSGRKVDFEAFTFSPDGKKLVSGSSDGTILWWRVSDGKLLHTLPGHSTSSTSAFPSVKSVAFSPDGKVLASGSLDGTIKLWNTSNYQVIRTISGHQKITSVAFSPDGKILASKGNDGTIKLWDVESGQILNTLPDFGNKIAFSLEGKLLISSGSYRGVAVWSVKTGDLVVIHRTIEDSWITYTPDNYYVCSEDAAKYIRWKQVDKTYDYAVFSEQFNKPEVVAERLRSLSAEQTTIATKPQSDNDTTPPKIIITSPPLARGQRVNRIHKHSGSNLTIAGQAMDESGVREVTVRGVAARLDENGKFSAEVLLQAGDNPITVMAMDNYGNQASESFTVRCENEPSSPALFGGRYFALLIAVYKYDHSSDFPTLHYPLIDAEKIKQKLTTGYTFKPENVVLLDNPNQHTILKTLTQLASKLQPTDKLLIFYAGHGHWDEDREQGYWIPRDAQPDSRTGWLSNSTLRDELRPFKAGHILLISDSCFSGSIFEKSRDLNNRPSTLDEDETAILELEKLPSRTAITSSAMTKVPDSSVLLKYLLIGLTENQRLHLPARKLFDSIQLPVIKDSKKVDDKRPIPLYNTIQEVGDKGGDFIFVRRRR